MHGFTEMMRAMIASSRRIGTSRRRFAPWRDRSGTSAIEFALLFPVFIVLFLGIVEFGRLLWMQSSLQQAVEAGARCAAVSGCTVNPADYAAAQMFALNVSSSIFQVKLGANCAIYDPHVDPNNPPIISGDLVKASLPFKFMVPTLFPWTITLSAQSCRPT